MMGGLFLWLIFGLVVYLLFFRRNGVAGCCGGHVDHSHRYPGRDTDASPGASRGHNDDDIIDLTKDDYRVH